MRTLVLLGLAACGGSSPSNVVSNTTPPAEARSGTRPFPAFERADVVVAAVTGELVAFTLAGDTATELGRVKLVDSTDEVIAFGEPITYLDRDHLVVRGGSETDFWIVSPAGATPLTAPPDETFAGIAKPASAESELERGSGGRAVRRGVELYWEHCAWGYAADGFQCEASGWIRMWPRDPAQQVVTTYPPGDDEEYTGWIESESFFLIGNDEDGHPTCPSAKGPVVLRPVTDHGHTGGETHFLADGVALVEFGDYGLDDFIASSFSVYASCGADPLFSGLQYQLFRDGFWVADEVIPGKPTENGDLPTVSRLRRQLKVLGDLPANRGVAIRPAR